MIDRAGDPRTEDTIVFDLLRTERGSETHAVIGTATFRNGRPTVDAPEEVAIAVSELLARAYVDRVDADERPRGYRRTGRGSVEMLVPGMPEHFTARLRGLWLPYPDGSVVTARPSGSDASTQVAPTPAAEPAEAGPPVTDPTVRRATLAASERILHVGPLIRSNAPAAGIRPLSERPGPTRTDCGWIV